MKLGEYSQTERQMMILAMLSSSERGYTFQEICSFLKKSYVEVSTKTIERDLDSITDSFFIFEEDRKGQTFYVANKYKIDNLQFDLPEMLSLYFAKEVMRGYGGIDVGKNALKIIDKIINKMPTINQAFIENLNKEYLISDTDLLAEKDINSELLDEIRDAIAKKKRISIKYHSFNSDESTEREVDPYLIEIQDGGYHIIGFCHLRKSLRVFRIARIQSIKVLKDSFERPLDLEDQIKKLRFDKLTGSNPEKVVLEFDASKSRYIKEYEAAKAEKILELENGGIRFERTVPITPDLIQWVLSFGAGVKVLEPKELARSVQENAEAMIKLYKEV